jgi:peptide deformylase
MILSLVTVPHQLLRQPSQPVDEMNSKNIQFLKDMANTLIRKNDPPGVGLSAIQVGTPARIFMTYLPPLHDLSALNGKQPPPEIEIYINPEITSKSKDITLGTDPKNPALEGCLSIPNLYGPVYRHQSITLRYQTLENFSSVSDQNQAKLITKTATYSNFFARVIQHEYDHLDGILFTDYTLGKSPIKSFSLLKPASDLYFDQGERLAKIPDPTKLIQW